MDTIEYTTIEGKSIKPWENLTMFYEDDQWHQVYEVIYGYGNLLITVVLERDIKAF
jgi:hypothetical protein